ncbi:MAG: hypothetical protein Q4G50_08870 [Corynebacterium sp.]|nr:hypothetical protein [Corynebacterium sp.]MDO5670101.1 hypothetical protein [Corynebacterium sp.]
MWDLLILLGAAGALKYAKDIALHYMALRGSRPKERPEILRAMRSQRRVE